MEEPTDNQLLPSDPLILEMEVTLPLNTFETVT